MHQTGQWPPTGHNAVDRAEIGTGSCSRCSVAGTFVEHASGEDHGSSTGLLSTTQARSTPGERSKGAATGLTHLAPICSLTPSASRFSAPFFPTLRGRSIVLATRPTRLHVAPIAPGVVAVGTRRQPARLDPLGHVLLVPLRAGAKCPVTAPPQRLGSATACIGLEARDTSHEACCDSSATTAPGSGAETLLLRGSPKYASIQPRWLPCLSS